MRITNDRRRKPRVRLGGAAVVHDGQAPLSCECIDLAIGGVGLRSAVKVKKGRKVMVALSLGDRSLTLPAVVARCRSAKGTWILGLRFGRIESDAFAMLETFIEGALSRDVRMYQAQVFLARTGAKSMDEVLGGGAALAGAAASSRTEPAPSKKEPDAEQDGSSPISLDDDAREMAAERAVTGPWSPAPPAAAAAEADKAERAPTGPWAPAPPAPSAASRPTPPPPTPTPTVPALPSRASDSLHTAVTSALSDLQSELDHSSSAPSSGGFDDPPPKGGTMIVRNPLLGTPPAQPSSSPPSAVATQAGGNVGAPSPGAPESGSSFTTDMSGLDFDDGAVSGGRHALGTQIVDPRVLAERSRGGAVRAPPLRVERPQSRAATFKANVADLELDDAPTQMFADPVPEPAPEPLVKRRSLPGETEIGPAPRREDATVFDTPPSPFGSGRARTVVPPSATATLTPPPPPGAPAPGHAQYGGAPQVATQSPASMPYGPVRGESTQVAMPAHGLPVAPASQPSSQQPPSPFGGGEAPPPSPFAPRPAQAAPSSTLRPPAAPAIKPPAAPAIKPPAREANAKPKIPSKARPAAAAKDARRTFTPEEAATRMRPKPAVQHDGPDPDPEFSAQYSRALADLDLENR